MTVMMIKKSTTKLLRALGIPALAVALVLAASAVLFEVAALGLVACVVGAAAAAPTYIDRYGKKPDVAHLVTDDSGIPTSSS